MSVKSIMERIYVEGADVSKGIPTEVVPTAVQAGGAAARRGEGRSARAGLPAVGETILFVLKELLEGRVPNLKSRARFG